MTRTDPEATPAVADRAAADLVVRLAAARPASSEPSADADRPTGEAPARRVIGIEGRSGSGKTTFAELVADAVERTGAPRPPVLHMDSLYPGWDGLAASVELVRAALDAPHLTHPTWDWAHDRPGENVRLPDGPWLVVEGIGCGAAPVRPLLDVLVWLDLPDAERKARALRRDGAAYAPHWERWAAQEEALLGVDDIRASADVVIGRRS